MKNILIILLLAIASIVSGQTVYLSKATQNRDAKINTIKDSVDNVLARSYTLVSELTTLKANLQKLIDSLHFITPTPQPPPICDGCNPLPAPTMNFDFIKKLEFSKLQTGAMRYSDHVVMSNETPYYSHGLGVLNAYGDTENRITITDSSVNGDPKKFARVLMEANQTSTNTGCDLEYELFPAPNAEYVFWNRKSEANWSLKQKYYELYTSFNVRFSKDFSFRDGHWGFFPMAGYVNVGDPNGFGWDNGQPDPNEGFNFDLGFGDLWADHGGQGGSVRYGEGTAANYYSWQTDSLLQKYEVRGKGTGNWHGAFYDADRPGEWSTQFSMFDANGKFMFIPVNQWINVTTRIVANTPGQNDGILEFYVNGTMIYQRTDVKWRVRDDIGMNAISWLNFFSNETSEFDQYVDYGDVHVFTYSQNYTDIARGLAPNRFGRTIPLPNWPIKNQICYNCDPSDTIPQVICTNEVEINTTNHEKEFTGKCLNITDGSGVLTANDSEVYIVNDDAGNWALTFTMFDIGDNDSIVIKNYSNEVLHTYTNSNVPEITTIIGTKYIKIHVTTAANAAKRGIYINAVALDDNYKAL